MRENSTCIKNIDFHALITEFTNYFTSANGVQTVADLIHSRVFEAEIRGVFPAYDCTVTLDGGWETRWTSACVCRFTLGQLRVYTGQCRSDGCLGAREFCEFTLGVSILNPREGMDPYIQRKASTFCSCELAALPANTQLQVQPAQQNRHKPPQGCRRWVGGGSTWRCDASTYPESMGAHERALLHTSSCMGSPCAFADAIWAWAAFRKAGVS